jgi:hypothetical protein
MDIIFIIRILITLTFLILAVGGPVAIWQLRRFIALYSIRQGELQVRIDALERRVARVELSGRDGKS